ncbi:hypothetical protein M406DRAFT_74078 [Cryphonectria parasitica EP155]|uniref:Uncharacterized protein n=1 Tax=Cryphonectria parasitica (strain ATCC 38755 / EP155) TaxID=660469 RepID=A0A9P4XYY3_CRYP1|nr:uncharacterized protein M406DRAFT_74078 [Cryphonectria parasitica EP155]KAF3763463.1 hypothetical protein M406DRAFT_74078 [Cryphonectria parasitica EP155]
MKAYVGSTVLLLHVIFSSILITFDIARLVTAWVGDESPWTPPGLIIAVDLMLGVLTIGSGIAAGITFYSTASTGAMCGGLTYRLFRELPAQRQLRHLYQTIEPTILFTESGDAVAVFLKGSTETGVELPHIRLAQAEVM